MNSPNFWSLLENLPGLALTAADWRARLGPDFAAVLRLCLRNSGRTAGSVSCPRACGCAHEVRVLPRGGYAGVCCCEPWNCDDLALEQEDIVIWEVDLPRLGRAVARALDLNPEVKLLPPPHTLQLGTWSTEAFPVIFAIATDPAELEYAGTWLAGSLRCRFVLCVPTLRLAGTALRQRLAGAQAGLVALENALRLTLAGLEPVLSPGALFTEFRPAPAPGGSEQMVAERAFALVRKLDSGKGKPSLVTVFRLYCLECLSSGEIARQLGVSRATVVRRLQLIRARTGVDPRRLRPSSSHLEQLRDSLHDPRARRPNPRAALEQDLEEP